MNPSKYTDGLLLQLVVCGWCSPIGMLPYRHRRGTLQICADGLSSVLCRR